MLSPSSMYQYVPDTNYRGKACTRYNLYKVHTFESYMEICTFLRYIPVCTIFKLHQVCMYWFAPSTYYIPVYNLCSVAAFPSLLKGTSMYILTLSEYIFVVPDSFERLQGPADLPARDSFTCTRIEPNHTKAYSLLGTTVPATGGSGWLDLQLMQTHSPCIVFLGTILSR